MLFCLIAFSILSAVNTATNREGIPTTSPQTLFHSPTACLLPALSPHPPLLSSSLQPDHPTPASPQPSLPLTHQENAVLENVQDKEAQHSSSRELANCSDRGGGGGERPSEGKGRTREEGEGGANEGGGRERWFTTTGPDLAGLMTMSPRMIQKQERRTRKRLSQRKKK
eukprot:746425-Hanusia_phi.AAC.8